VSVGVATLGPGAGYSHDNAVQLADRALYAAKAGGRDRWLAVREQDREAAPLPDGPDGADAVLQTAS
jgi:hypothetical protein